MNIVFFGTSEFAVPVLQAIGRSRHSLQAVVTNPDRPSGRGRKMTASFGREEAVRLNVPVFQPEKLDECFLETFTGIEADIGVVASYGRIIPPGFLNALQYGIINVHPSLLPKYRGPSPVQQPILRGDKETGVTIILITPEMDSGPVILQEKLKLKGNETAGTLHDRLADIGGKLTVRSLDLIEKGKARFVEQDESLAEYCGKIEKKDGLISWNAPAAAIERHVRAMTPWPGAFTFSKGGRRIIINAASVESLKSPGAAPGTVMSACGKEGLCVASADGIIRIQEISPAGSRKMTSAEFVRGERIAEGDRLVSFSGPEQP